MKGYDEWLQSGDPGQQPEQPLTFVEQVEELRYLGYNDLQIAAMFRIKPESLARQLHRKGSPSSVK